ncbi:MAG: right-handed parallel beta-helix repeat-containing protein [Saprospiraceae bacterium]|nr:right-handed parallel beta-helix repeat-containing protein [Saprospiraceae bacterium]
MIAGHSRIIVFVLLFISYSLVQARIRHIGAGHPWTSPSSIQNNVVAGDTVIIHAGSYAGAFFISNLAGTPTNPIIIEGASGENVVFSGGSESFHFSDISYVSIQNLIFQNQTGNGMNIDDAGTFNSPSHHIVIRNCTFRNISASGNNDLLKLSGVDDFEVSDCTFLNGASGGSGIDMVGCHRGLFQRLRFEQLGSNSIQIKGGSKDITIRRNYFLNGGARAINIGGSTDLEFFRPQNASYEASTIEVYSNVIEGSEASFAFVGAVDCKVYNNTLLRPGKWAMRILQETVDASRFEACGRNSVQNNIFILTTAVSTEVNIGPDTAPSTFIYSNNLWYKQGQANWQGPMLPVSDPSQVLGDPTVNNTTYMISSTSPAYQKGKSTNPVVVDYYGKNFRTPPSIGAVEFEGSLAISPQSESGKEDVGFKLKLYPNPAIEVIHLVTAESGTYQTVDGTGRVISRGNLESGINTIPVGQMNSGVYYLIVQFKYHSKNLKWIKL